MGNNNLRYFLIFVFVILSLYFVLATSAPTGLDFNNNVTAVYDEGNFSVNWTSGGGVVKNYSVYIFADNTLYIKDWNDTATGYSFNNWTEANYTFIIGALNTTGSGNEANSTNISMYVDRTAPVITFPVYTNGTLKKNTDTLTLNISVIDVFSGETGSVCLVDVNGTNESVAVSGEWCNSTSFSLTGLTDGNKTIKVYVNDTVNILGLNNSYTVDIDTTAPSVSLTESSSGQTSLRLTISGGGTCTADRSGATISGSTLTETGLDCGKSYTYTVTCTDSAGNSGSSSATSFTTDGCGGKITIPQSKQKTHSWSKITPGVTAIMKDFDEDMGIKQIQIEVNNEAQSVKITVTKYNDKPAAVTISKTGKVYKYLQIEATNLADELGKATVTLQIGKSWLSSNDLDADNVALFRFGESAGQWNELVTTHVGSEGDNELYDVELTSFSFFAISEKSAAVAEGAVAEGGETAPPSRNLVWLWVVIAILVLVLIGWRMKKKKTR